ncbi:MAG: Crp/Fnr family transcriptional regulator [Chloroflexi bacterium]|uniref:Crp/Fnr family transcriptional regulator n=1 Tax=Candidatus Chlorohelix allophototropha TaxID=3003348 RepID=A0A8T7M0B9_9CHLR|nr:Crp/Fnr family transcriptional regulator [Chloroflexota bacterium]WJW67107.1 Crp/Fnr family transcriptional regulator [Chloroflexota bacterium L227-S17]
MSQREFQKDLEQLPSGLITNLVSRVAAQSKNNWLANNDERDVGEVGKSINDLTPSLTNYHFKLWNLLGNALATGNFSEVAHLVEEEGRALANRRAPLQAVMDNTSACLSHWVSMILNEAEKDGANIAQPRAFQALVRRLNQLQSRLLIAMVSGFNEQIESGDVWLHRPSEHRSIKELLPSHQNLSDSFSDQLASITGEYSISRYRAGVPIFSDNHDVQRSRFYFIRFGTVQIQEYLPDGRALTLTILGKGDVFARFAGGSSSSQTNYFKDFQAETMRESELVWVDETALLRAMERSPVVAAGIIKSFSTQLASVQQLIQGLLGRDVSVRLAHLLLKLADEFGVQKQAGSIYIDYPLSHQRLADMMGSNRVTVTRQLSELQKQGILEIQRRSITLFNRKLLESFGPWSTNGQYVR